MQGRGFKRNQQGFSLIELAVSIGILVVVMLAAITVFLQSKQTTTLSSEASLAKHGAELMLDLIRADGGGIPNFSDHYTVYGGSARVPFGYDTASPPTSINNPERFGWSDPLTGRPRLRNVTGWLFAAVDADERLSPPVASAIVTETLFAGNDVFGQAVTGVDLNGDQDEDDDNVGLNSGVGNSYTGDLLPITIVVEWETGEGGNGPERRTFKLHTMIPRED